MEVHGLPSETFQAEVVVQQQLDDKTDLCESLMFADDAVNQLLEHEDITQSVALTIPNELGSIRFAIELAEGLVNKEELLFKAKKDSEMVNTQENEDQIQLKCEDNVKGVHLERAELEISTSKTKSEQKQDPKLRSNSFYGRRDTLLKTVRKFRNDFPECDAIVFGNWRLQDNTNKFWPKDLSDFGQKQTETIINFLDSRYKFPCEASLWDRYKNDTTDTRRAKLSKKRKMFERKVSQLAALGNNDIFFLLMYPTKEYKEINNVCHCWIDHKVVQRPYGLIYEFLKRLEEFKTNQVYNLTLPGTFRTKHKELLEYPQKNEDRIMEGELNATLDLVEPTIVLEKLASQMNTDHLSMRSLSPKRQKIE